MVSREEVRMAYLLILGREAESEEAVTGHCQRHASLAAMRMAFLDSAEFRSRAGQPPPATDLGAALSVDIDVEPNTLQEMFGRVEQCWRALGEIEPYWSVVSKDEFKTAAFAANSSDFYNSGVRDTERLLAWLERNQVDLQSIQSCCEYGCGVGRVTRWLCARFPRVLAYDISEAHIRLANQHLSDEGLSNVTFCRMDTIASLCRLEPVDLIVSIVVLQHNPPPVIAHILRMLLRSLKRHGIAYFQVPTYRAEYSFDARCYLATPASATSFEMHVLPQKAVFQIVREENCVVLEVQPDHYVGDASWVSNTVLVQRV